MQLTHEDAIALVERQARRFSNQWFTGDQFDTKALGQLDSGGAFAGRQGLWRVVSGLDRRLRWGSDTECVREGTDEQQSSETPVRLAVHRSCRQEGKLSTDTRRWLRFYAASCHAAKNAGLILGRAAVTITAGGD